MRIMNNTFCKVSSLVSNKKLLQQCMEINQGVFSFQILAFFTGKLCHKVGMVLCHFTLLYCCISCKSNSAFFIIGRLSISNLSL